MAGARSFERGVGYLSAVSRLDIGDEAITATVDGSDTYEVELTEDGADGLTGWCNCPYGQEGNFCKHCVAVGQAVLGQAESVPQKRSAAASRTRLLDTWLESRIREELLTLVREQLADDRDRCGNCRPSGRVLRGWSGRTRLRTASRGRNWG
ncbi:SWIM zinc finger domain-containing protein [Streptomyces nojiriensis]|uniref:SWIM zinc finger family protein n=1 Tax=Streptomyces nojiriensis TaxID=66374 RepID=UPI00369615BD